MDAWQVIDFAFFDHFSNNFSVLLWLTNSFFWLAMMKRFKARFLSKTHLWVHCNFKFWIWSCIFFSHRAQLVTYQIIFQYYYDCWNSFLYLLWLEATKLIFVKNMPANSFQLQILNLRKQFFRSRAQKGMCQTIFQHYHNHWISFLYLLWLDNVKFIFLLKSCLWVYYSFKFWIQSNSFLVGGHNRACIKWFFSDFMIAENRFLRST